MNRSQQRAALVLGLLMITAVVLGCASNERVEPAAYEQELVSARTTIAQAEQSGATQYGSAQLALAREKLREAEIAADDGESARAQQLAIEAKLDAELADAITRNAQTQALAAEVQSGLSTLEGELRRSGSDGLDRR